MANAQGGPSSSSVSRAGGSRAGSSSSSSSFLPTKSQLNPTHKTSSSLSSKFGRFVENVLSSPSSSSSSGTGGPSAGGEAGERAIRRGWVDLVPEQAAGPSAQARNPFLVQQQSTSQPISRRPTPTTTLPVGIPEERSPSSSAHPSSTGVPHPALSASLPQTPSRQPSLLARSTPPTPPSFSRQPSSSANSFMTAAGDKQVFVPASSPSLRSTWTRKTRPRASTTSSATLPSTPKWSWTGSLGKGFGTPTASTSKGKQREPIDSGWGEPDDMLPTRDETRAVVEDEGFYDGLDSEKGFDLIASLPTEIALYIYLFLPLPTLAVCASVSHTWNDLASDSSIWRTYFNSIPSWHLRPSYIESLAAPTLASRLGALSLSCATPTTTPTKRPAPMPRTPSSVSKIRELSHQDDFAIGHTGGSIVVPWKKVCEKRLWLDRRWGDEKVGREMILKGHADSVYCLQFDDKKLVTGSRDQHIKVWDLATETCLQTVHAHDASVLCLMFDEESGFMVSGGSDAKIIVWDLGGPGLSSKSLTKQTTLHGHRQGVLDIALNENYIVSCSKDTTLLVHSRSTPHTHLHTLRGHTGPVNAIGLQGSQVASASGDGKIKLWDLESGECLRTMEGHERGLACVDFKGEFVVSGSNDRTIKIFSALTGQCLRTLQGHTDLVRTLSISPTADRIVSGGYDKQILIWSLSTGELTHRLESSHTSLVFDIRFDSGRVVSASHDRRVCVWDWGDEEGETGRMFR